MIPAWPLTSRPACLPDPLLCPSQAGAQLAAAQKRRILKGGPAGVSAAAAPPAEPLLPAMEGQAAMEEAPAATPAAEALPPVVAAEGQVPGAKPAELAAAEEEALGTRPAAAAEPLSAELGVAAVEEGAAEREVRGMPGSEGALAVGRRRCCMMRVCRCSDSRSTPTPAGGGGAAHG